ncbi:cyclic nucleotide-binding protein [Chitinophaga rupis]|uniref:Cyclic nucleotide-binding protein n=1 Tax=Chitinophaga rupis TaxID=573321 RepID=A0A1H7REZ0_9BACT|nr:Crp/Fnr family transcriptional regulator [Chitinophaga rupis]SEL58801.1 cyclic nucleotide-binding protein [Chitinophaga rupis]
MITDIFFRKIRTYAALTEAAEAAWTALLRENKYARGENFIREGQVPNRLAFVVTGLFSQYYTSDDGSMVIKYFFPEQRIAGSMSAMLKAEPGAFTITALEDTTVLEYDFAAFKQLVAQYPDIAAFYIRYMEQHWIVEKEPYEISLRHDTAKKRYEELLHKYPQLIKRLKKHQIASYLGITPTQLSRIFFANK